MSGVELRRVAFEPDYDVAPHAVFSRALRWFTMKVRTGRDDLDEYEGVSFAIGNEITFDLRTYAGHPRMTVSLYLRADFADEREIGRIIDIVVKRLLIPLTAIAWRRGQPFEFGELVRHKDDRLREAEARVIVLKIAAQQPKRAASTSFLKREVQKYIELSPGDLQWSKSRRNEQLYQQVIGNVISHKDAREGPFAKGYAVRTQDGLQVTTAGMRYLNSIGFEVAS